MTVGIIGNTAKPALQEVFQLLMTYLKEKKVSFFVHNELWDWFVATGGRNDGTVQSCETEHLVANSEMIIALGGDGTILTAARMIGKSEVPILGINLGKLGFLTEVSLEELPTALDGIFAGDYLLEKRVAIQATCVQDTSVFFALNDIVIDKGSSSRTIELEMYINDDYLVTYAADGLILTTPTGSTAYSLASGGPIVLPESEVIVINPLAAHSLTARPVVVPDNKVIRVKVESSVTPLRITADGQVQEFYNPPIEFLVQKASYTVALVRRKKHSHYEILRSKLYWGKDVRLQS